MKKLPQKIIDQIIKDKKVRIKLAHESHELFFSIYLPHYLIYPSAPFHEEFFDVTEDTTVKHAVITAFRGSGKSTIMTFSYPLWSILGKQQKKFILILGHTIYQARIYMKNIKEELESNDLLRADLGPFREENEWQAHSIVIPKYNARITCASYEQGIRGLRHRQYRPDLIICDDVEDLESVKTQESRDKTHTWLTGDVIPAGDQNTRVIIIGNLLHEDCLLMRLKKSMEDGQFNGIYREYPFIDKNGNVLWQSKFPNQETIDAEKRKIGNEIAWLREYMLEIVAEEGRVVRLEWIKYYGILPDIDDEKNQYRYSATGIDLAAAQNEAAKFTAMVSARVYNWGNNIEIYILPDPINERLEFPEQIEKAKQISKSLGNGCPTTLYIEKAGCQEFIVQQLQKENYPAIGVTTAGQDKRARLSVISPLIKNGNVFFPKNGAEKLIQQIVNFGIEKYNDLMDAFSMLIGEIMKDNEYRTGDAFDWMDDDEDDGNDYDNDRGPLKFNDSDRLTLDREI